jgi:SAM-dependent methyltransferase
MKAKSIHVIKPRLSLYERYRALGRAIKRPEDFPAIPYPSPVFSRETPSHQTAVDIFSGHWLSAFPEEAGVKAGEIKHFDFNVEQRVKWAADQLPNGIKDFRILELGPFEAYNTWQMEQLGATSVLAIEGNNQNYLKCLIVKEILGLQARFLYGDFIQYFENSKDSYDMVWASGVLYHQTHPVKLLGQIASCTRRIFLHTHYYREDTIQANAELARNFYPEGDIEETFGGFRAHLHYRSYAFEKWQNKRFSGGLSDHSYWMTQDDIMACLRHFGFQNITVGVDHPQNPNGPALFLLAEKGMA